MSVRRFVIGTGMVCLFGTMAHAGRPSLVVLQGDRFVTDLRYGTTTNFLRQDVYSGFGLRACYVEPEVKLRVERVVPDLRKSKLKLVLFDCFRPVEVQQVMWRLVPDARYVANPVKGSNHNRGVAIDVGLARENGELLRMPTDFDDFTAKASADYPCPPEDPEPCRNRELLKRLMKKAGLEVLPTEWWHYQLPDGRQYPLRSLSDVPTH